MYNRFWSLLICSTALVTSVSASAGAEDMFMVQLAKPTVENMALNQSSNGSSQTPAAPSNTSTVLVPSDPNIKPLQVIGNAPSAADLTAAKAQSVTTAPDAAPAPLQQDTKPVIPLEPAVKAETQPAPPTVGSASVPTQPEPTIITAVPQTTVIAPAYDAQANTPAVATAPLTPATDNSATPIPNASEAIPAQASTAAPAPTPVAIVPPAIPVQPSITQDMITAAIKGEIDATFGVSKPADEKKLTVEEKKSRAAVIAFYDGRSDLPLWVDAKGLNRAAGQAIDRLAHAQEDGLNPEDYPVPSISGEHTADILAKAEIALTESAMKYARQAQAGRFDPNRLGELVTEKPTVPDPGGVLKTLAAASNVSEALEAYNPPHEGYKRLKEKLAEILAGKPLVPQARVPAGPTIRPGEKDTRIALLRNRLGVTGTATADDAAIYDDSLVEAVKSFQKTRGLKPSGLIGQQTVDAVNNDSPVADTRAADIIANMERWRWLARDLGELHVMVNIPDFSLTVVRDGVVTHKTKAIVGRVANPTPVFSETMTHIIVNPYWNVPYSIVKKEYLAKAQETNGAALQRGNFEVEVGNKTVDPTTVDWTTVNASEIHLRQRPGEGNALGNIKFMFPNQHSVYIHDTSSRGLFVQSYRSLSHGCVRVQDPFSFADALLAEEPTAITGAKLKSMIGGGGEKYLWLKKTIPVHIAYFTDFVDDAGVLQTRPDLYGHNAKTKQLLGL